MRIVVTAVGRLRQGPERDLAERYRKRVADLGRSIGLQSLEVIEIRESRAGTAARRMLEESIAIANIVPAAALNVVLDEGGESLSSRAFAAKLKAWRTDGRPAVAFVIGGPDGLAVALRKQASLRLSFGAATWPHQLARIMLLEQLYRAATILSGHPYHRG